MSEPIDQTAAFVSGNQTRNHAVTVEPKHSAAMHYVALCLCGWKAPTPAVSRSQAVADGASHLQRSTPPSTYTAAVADRVAEIIRQREPLTVDELKLLAEGLGVASTADLLPPHLLGTANSTPPQPTQPKTPPAVGEHPWWCHADACCVEEDGTVGHIGRSTSWKPAGDDVELVMDVRRYDYYEETEPGQVVMHLSVEQTEIVRPDRSPIVSTVHLTADDGVRLMHDLATRIGYLRPSPPSSTAELLPTHLAGAGGLNR